MPRQLTAAHLIQIATATNSLDNVEANAQIRHQLRQLGCAGQDFVRAWRAIWDQRLIARDKPARNWKKEQADLDAKKAAGVHRRRRGAPAASAPSAVPVSPPAAPTAPAVLVPTPEERQAAVEAQQAAYEAELAAWQVRDDDLWRQVQGTAGIEQQRLMSILAAHRENRPRARA